MNVMASGGEPSGFPGAIEEYRLGRTVEPVGTPVLKHIKLS